MNFRNIIEGDEAFKLGKSYENPNSSKVKLIKKYKENLPIFNFYDVETQISHIFNPEVQLKSGGSIVISPTEALVSIDVNSGKPLQKEILNQQHLKQILKQLKKLQNS